MFQNREKREIEDFKIEKNQKQFKIEKNEKKKISKSRKSKNQRLQNYEN